MPDGKPVVLHLSLGPSVNNLYLNRVGHGRIRTKEYRAWREAAGWEIVAQRPGSIAGPYTLHIVLPKLPPNSDPDNRIKCLSDALQDHGVIDNDKHCRGIKLERDDSAELVRIEVRPA